MKEMMKRAKERKKGKGNIKSAYLVKIKRVEKSLEADGRSAGRGREDERRHHAQNNIVDKRRRDQT
jgi:hypothetical protein